MGGNQVIRLQLAPLRAVRVAIVLEDRKGNQRSMLLEFPIPECKPLEFDAGEDLVVAIECAPETAKDWILGRVTVSHA
jgi:hypothetical protein